jgi:hypothetical protein
LLTYLRKAFKVVSIAKLNGSGKLTPPLKAALAQAGVAVKSLNERAWLWLHDHPGSTVNACADSLKESRGDVSSVVSLMWRRDMVTFVEAYLDRSRPNMKSRLYSTKGKVFAVKPVIRESSRPSKKTLANNQREAALLIAPTPAPIPTPTPVAEVSIEERMEGIVEKLTIKEARCLFEKLKALLLG